MSRRPIKDKFTNLRISRQMKYQLRKQAQGLCITCGKRKLVNGVLCTECSKKRGVKEPGKNTKRKAKR